MKVFLDTNTIMDHLFNRKYNKEMNIILKLCYQKKITAYLSTASIYTLTYLIARNSVHQFVQVLLKDYLSTIELHQSSPLAILNGLSLDFKDLEDAYQYHSALEIEGLNCFLTRNLKDFPNLSKIEILDPKMFLEKYFN